MKEVFIDTNVILRLLLGDQRTHHQRAFHLFKKAEEGEFILVLTTEVFLELIYVLSSFYEQSRDDIVSLMEGLMFHQGIKLSEREFVHDAWSRFCSTKVDIADCLLAARSQLQGSSIASFDKDFQKFPDANMHPF